MRVVRDGEAADHVGVAAEVLRRRVHDDVGAEVERALEVGRREGVVDHEERACRLRRLVAAAAMSADVSSGFVGVSSQTRRVAGTHGASRDSPAVIDEGSRSPLLEHLVKMR